MALNHSFTSENGYEWLQRLCSIQPISLRTGIRSIDSELREKCDASILQIMGSSLSGKTELVLAIVVNHLLYYPDSVVYYVAFGMTAPAKRLLQLLRFKTSEKKARDLLRRAVLVAVEDDHDFFEFLRNFSKLTKNKVASLLVIDNLSNIIPDGSDAARQIKDFYYMINLISTQRRLPIIITSHIIRYDSTFYHSLGVSWLRGGEGNYLYLAEGSESAMLMFVDKFLQPVSRPIKIGFNDSGFSVIND